MTEERNYEYVAAEVGQSCLICRSSFRPGEIIKLYDGYRRICISAGECVHKRQNTPIPAPPPAHENIALTEALKSMTAAARRNYGGHIDE